MRPHSRAVRHIRFHENAAPSLARITRLRELNAPVRPVDDGVRVPLEPRSGADVLLVTRKHGERVDQIMAGVERAVRADPSFMMQTDWIKQAERLMAR